MRLREKKLKKYICSAHNFYLMNMKNPLMCQSSRTVPPVGRWVSPALWTTLSTLCLLRAGTEGNTKMHLENRCRCDLRLRDGPTHHVVPQPLSQLLVSLHPEMETICREEAQVKCPILKVQTEKLWVHKRQHSKEREFKIRPCEPETHRKSGWFWFL